MNRLLKDVCEKGTNLYESLELEVLGGIDPSSISSVEIKKQFRILALKYHPDKSTEEMHAQRFHEISVALRILTDDSLRNDYDEWYKQKFVVQVDPTRQGLIDKLKRDEASDKRNDRPFQSGVSISDIQRYGETLRKLKHFKKSYGDWKTPSASSTSSQPIIGDNKAQYYDSSTLRLELEGTDPVLMRNLSQKKSLIKFLDRNSTIRSQDIDDIYYSERNKPGSDVLVAYMVLIDPQIALETLRTWKQTQKSFLSHSSVVISNVSPRIPTHYYHDINIAQPIELNTSIQQRISNIRSTDTSTSVITID